MKTYLVGYDLNKPGQDYSKLIGALKTFPNWWSYLDSTWILKTDWSAEQVRNYLWRHMDGSDELLVVRLAGEAAWIGFTDAPASPWLMTNITYS